MNQDIRDIWITEISIFSYNIIWRPSIALNELWLLIRLFITRTQWLSRVKVESIHLWVTHLICYNNTMLRRNIFVLLSFLFGGVTALQCDVPGFCVGQLIGFTVENSSTECLSACKGMYMMNAKIKKTKIRWQIFQTQTDAAGTPLYQMTTSAAF